MSKFSVQAVFKAIDKVTAPVSRMANRVGKFTSGFQKGLSGLDRGLNKVTSGIKKFGKTAAVAIGVAVFGMSKVVRTGAEFELNMIRAGTKFGQVIKKTSPEFKRLATQVRDLAKVTEFTATQASRGIDTLATAGFKAKESIGALPVVMDLATVAQTDLDRATEIAVKTLGIFNLRTTKAKQNTKNLRTVVDLLAKGSTSATLTIETLFEALSNGAGAAAEANISMEDSVTILAALANAGIDASRAGIVLRNMTLAISAPTSEAARAMRFLRIETTQVVNGQRQFRNVIDIFKDLQIAMRKLEPAARATIMKAIFGKRTIEGASKLLKQSGKQVDDLRERITKFNGASREMASITRDSTSIQLLKFSSVIDELKLKIFDITKGPLGDLVRQTIKWVNANDKIIAQNVGETFEKIVNNAPKIIKWVKWLGIATAAIFGLSLAIKALSVVMAVFSIISAINPIVLLLALIAAAIANIVVKLNDLSGTWGEVWQGMKMWVDDVSKSIRETLGLMSEMEATKFANKVTDNFAAVEERTARAALLSKRAGLGTPESRSQAFAEKLRLSDGPLEPRQLLGPEEKLANTIQEKNERIEVTLKDETGRAEITKGKASGGAVTLEPSGIF